MSFFVPIHTLLFDADGVIQTWDAAAVASLQAELPRSEDLRAFLDDLFQAEAPCIRGEADFLPALQGVLDRWDVATPATELLRLWSAIHQYPGMHEIIAGLQRSGVVCALATNQQSYRADIMRALYDDVFDHNFYSCDLGAAKPDAEYFEKIIQVLDIDAAHALFIDDKAENTASAATVGLNVLTFNARELEQPHVELTRQLQDQFGLF